jgi:hypothetical protein
MSNIAGKAYAMNLLTPLTWFWSTFNQFIFFVLRSGYFLSGLLQLSLIHYARWVIVNERDFPRETAAVAPPSANRYCVSRASSNR